MPKKPKAKRGPLPHPLAQLRATLGWTREQCAKETGIPAPTIQNIERATTPLTWEQARIIDAVTGCHGYDLGHKSEQWRTMFRIHPAILGDAAADPVKAAEYAPMTLEGNPYSKEFFERYSQDLLAPGTRENAIEDLTMRIKLLLGPLAKEPRKFRRAYRHIAQVFDDELAAAKLGDLDMANYAERFGKAMRKDVTVKELETQHGFANEEDWLEVKKTKNLKADDVIQLTLEKMPFWPKHKAMSVTSEKAMFIGDYAFGYRWVWRMVLPDGTPYAFATNKTKSVGLRQAIPTHLQPKAGSDKS
jgi:hypothetical protein